jgi:hypothetical protein
MTQDASGTPTTGSLGDGSAISTNPVSPPSGAAQASPPPPPASIANPTISYVGTAAPAGATGQPVDQGPTTPTVDTVQPPLIPAGYDLSSSGTTGTGTADTGTADTGTTPLTGAGAGKPLGWVRASPWQRITPTPTAPAACPPRRAR